MNRTYSEEHYTHSQFFIINISMFISNLTLVIKKFLFQMNGSSSRPERRLRNYSLGYSTL